MKSETRPKSPVVGSNRATVTTPSRVRPSSVRGSEALIPSRDREGAVVKYEPGRHTAARRAPGALRIQPRSSRERVWGASGAGWKLAITAPPVEGKANAA